MAMNRSRRIFSLLLAASLPIAHASANQPEIQQVVANSEDHVVTVLCSNFSGRGPVRLAMAGYTKPLEVMSLAPGHIRARLPEGIQPGSYLLRVHGLKADIVDEFAFTFGTVGPALDETR
jgi:hypothetical protein